MTHYGRDRVELTLARIGPKAVITVTDDGPGVNDEEQQAIFVPASEAKRESKAAMDQVSDSRSPSA